VAQILICEGLFQYRALSVFVAQKVRAIARREYKWHAAGGESVSYGITTYAPEIHVERGGVEYVRINQAKRLVNRPGYTHRRASELGQHVFESQTDKHVILNSEDTTTGQ
jgi:hypothetical protein